MLPKLRQGEGLQIGFDFSVRVDAGLAPNLAAELEQALADLDIGRTVQIEQRQED